MRAVQGNVQWLLAAKRKIWSLHQKEKPKGIPTQWMHFGEEVQRND